MGRQHLLENQWQVHDESPEVLRTLYLGLEDVLLLVLLFQLK